MVFHLQNYFQDDPFDIISIFLQKYCKHHHKFFQDTNYLFLLLPNTNLNIKEILP